MIGESNDADLDLWIGLQVMLDGLEIRIQMKGSDFFHSILAVLTQRSDYTGISPPGDLTSISVIIILIFK